MYGIPKFAIVVDGRTCVDDAPNPKFRVRVYGCLCEDDTSSSKRSKVTDCTRSVRDDRQFKPQTATVIQELQSFGRIAYGYDGGQILATKPGEVRSRADDAQSEERAHVPGAIVHEGHLFPHLHR
jgi:hypothetical protein